MKTKGKWHFINLDSKIKLLDPAAAIARCGIVFYPSNRRHEMGTCEDCYTKVIQLGTSKSQSSLVSYHGWPTIDDNYYTVPKKIKLPKSITEISFEPPEEE